MNFFDQLVNAYTFDNVSLLVVSAITFAFGFWEYIYSFRLVFREHTSPFPIWMHTFYIAHDSTFAVLFFIEASKRNWNWFCLAVSIALVVWNAFEFVCVYYAIKYEREEIFGGYVAGEVTERKALLLIIAQTIAMYGIVWMIIMYVGKGCFFQWACVTNMVMAAGPTTLWMKRRDRRGMSIGLALVILAGTINNFLPCSMFATVFPEVFRHPTYYITGVIFVAIAVSNVMIVKSKPAKPYSGNGKKPIW